MKIGPISKCFKVSAVEDKNAVVTIEGDVLYVRSHPFVYLNTGNDTWKAFAKVYVDPEHPKYNMDKIHSLTEPFMFKLENMGDLSATPAKVGDLIYRNGDAFMYMKMSAEGLTTYKKILKV